MEPGIQWSGTIAPAESINWKVMKLLPLTLEGITDPSPPPTSTITAQIIHSR